MTSELSVEDFTICITRKRVRYLRLSVSGPQAQVRVSAPLKVPDFLIQQFILQRLPWIRKQRERFKSLKWELPLEFVSGETHYLLGRAFELDICPSPGRPKIELTEDNKLRLFTRPDWGRKEREALLYRWYRQRFLDLVPELLQKWEPRLEVSVQEWGIKRMKTRWGTCNTSKARIWLNLELIKFPLEILEYVLLHELVHLLERKHSKRFYRLMELYLPQWKTLDAQLNSMFKRQLD